MASLLLPPRKRFLDQYLLLDSEFDRTSSSPPPRCTISFDDDDHVSQQQQQQQQGCSPSQSEAEDSDIAEPPAHKKLRSGSGGFMEEALRQGAVVYLKKKATNSDVDPNQHRFQLTNKDISKSHGPAMAKLAHQAETKGPVEVRVLDRDWNEYRLQFKYINSSRTYRFMGPQYSHFLNFSGLEAGRDVTILGLPPGYKGGGDDVQHTIAFFVKETADPAQEVSPASSEVFSSLSSSSGSQPKKQEAAAQVKKPRSSNRHNQLPYLERYPPPSMTSARRRRRRRRRRGFIEEAFRKRIARPLLYLNKKVTPSDVDPNLQQVFSLTWPEMRRLPLEVRISLVWQAYDSGPVQVQAVDGDWNEYQLSFNYLQCSKTFAFGGPQYARFLAGSGLRAGRDVSIWGLPGCNIVQPHTLAFIINKDTIVESQEELGSINPEDGLPLLSFWHEKKP